jgi:phage terminase large subunit-like protein
MSYFGDHEEGREWIERQRSWKFECKRVFEKKKKPDLSEVGSLKYWEAEGFSDF